MTEVEWLTATGPQPMLDYLRGKASDRKLRLFAVACCRRIEKWMSDKRSLHAVEVSDQYADRRVGRKTLSAARRAAFDASKRVEVSQLDGQSDEVGHIAAIVALNASSSPENDGSVTFGAATAGSANTLIFRLQGDDAGWLDLKQQGNLLREVFGNPFRPVAVDPAWRTETVVALAAGVYAERAFDRMPILADALQDAGCDNDDILTHCRGDGPHARGCWVVDLVLGKS